MPDNDECCQCIKNEQAGVITPPNMDAKLYAPGFTPFLSMVFLLD